MRMVILVWDRVFCGLVLIVGVLGSFIVVMCVVVLRRAGMLWEVVVWCLYCVISECLEMQLVLCWKGCRWGRNL